MHIPHNHATHHPSLRPSPLPLPLCSEFVPLSTKQPLLLTPGWYSPQLVLCLRPYLRAVLLRGMLLQAPESVLLGSPSVVVAAAQEVLMYEEDAKEQQEQLLDGGLVRCG